MFCVQVKHIPDVGIGSAQKYSMEDQYESVNLADYDVVRSTQFADEMSRGVHVSYKFMLEMKAVEAWPFLHMNCIA